LHSPRFRGSRSVSTRERRIDDLERELEKRRRIDELETRLAALERAHDRSR
jgi:predicted RNase H-like nuclease (RuvC/YqgF family)